MGDAPDIHETVKQQNERWEQFRLPERYFGDSPAHEAEENESIGPTPLLVFVNPKSGGQRGEDIAQYLTRALGSHQVYRVGKQCTPEGVLKKLWARLEEAAAAGDKAASKVKSKLCLLACGGDGTIAWVLNCVRILELKPCPPVAVAPLGTGNGLSINFGWGKRTQADWHQNLIKVIESIPKAAVRSIDLWSINLSTPSSELVRKDSLPAALETSETKSPASGAADGEGPPAVDMAGEFCYYFTFGLDAEAAYRFDRLRRHKPWLTLKRKVNIFWYMWFVIRTGWFCGASPLTEKLVSLQVKGKDGEWQDVKISHATRALLILNLQTYSGSRDVWGLKDERPEEGAQKGFVPPIFDDGLIEVVGLEGGFKSWAALSGLRRQIHGRRIAQASELRIRLHSPKLHKGVAMRLDGEPWWQDLPDGAQDDIVVDIKRCGTAYMLLNTSQIPGMTPRLKEIAEREKRISQPTDSKAAGSS